MTRVRSIYNKTKAVVTTKLFLMIVFSVFLVFLLWQWNYHAVISDDDRGTYGDMFGAVNAAFSGLAFAGIIITIILQMDELKAQRQELELTRNEFKKQNDTLKRARFEDTFFRLLNMLNETAESVVIKSKMMGGHLRASGRDSFEVLYKDMKSEVDGARIQEHNKITGDSRPHYHHSFSKYSLPLDTYLKFYDQIFDENQATLGHYFRTLYNILRFVKESGLPDKEEEYKYTRFIRAQLSTYELLILFYNCLSRHGRKKHYDLLVEYSMLKNINTSLLFEPFVHSEKYPQKAYDHSAKLPEVSYNLGISRTS